MKYIFLLLGGMVVMLTAAQSGELFRWVDTNGVVHYSDTPPADAASVERKKLTGDVSPNEDLPYETRQAQKNFPVTLYVGKGCGETCDQARSLLSKRGIPYSEKTLQTKQDVEDFKQLSGIDGVVPVLAVGKFYLKGLLADQWESELDIAGYPKFAGYRATPPKSPVYPAEGAVPESQVAPANPPASLPAQ